MASSEAKNLVRHYLNKIEEWENISDSEDSKRANYMFWKKEFFTRINDLELATDRFDNQFWIKALKARIKEMHDAMSSLHYLRDDMRAAYDDIKKVEEQLEAYGMEDYVTGDVRMGSLNEVECKLLFDHIFVQPYDF